MRLPKKVLINNIPFKVIRDKKHFGGHFSYKKSSITVGSKGKPRETLENFIHEVAEISAVERGMRGTKCKPTGKTDEFIFHGSHREFQDVVTDVSRIIGDLMKLE